MKSIIRFIGNALWIISGILMFIFWIGAMSRWLGFIGFVLALLLTPGLVIFPIVFWIVEKTFPTFYFIMWIIGIIGAIITGFSSIKND